jgi:FkbM family methyltransferase
MIRWTIATRLLPGCEVIIPFVNNSKLSVTPGRWGSEANALCGLHDFSDMGFLLHFLRPTDLFCDVGSNVGEYTVLASAAIGARSLAFEPVHGSYTELRKNIEINQITPLVDARCMAIGSAHGYLTLTSDQDTQNHVIAHAEDGNNDDKVVVETNTLDNVLAGKAPQLLKVDVEGWEQEVFQGAATTLRDPTLLSIIVELNQSGKRYGFADDTLHQTLLSEGFATFRYLPLDRKLISLNHKHNPGGNTLYIRNPEVVNARLHTAPSFTVRNMHI